MKIIVFTINPIFHDKVTGGASKHLYYITRFLGDQGHQVEILCPETEELNSPFNLNNNVDVFPELPFDLPFPQPYAVSPPSLSLITSRISERLQNADRFYIHDGEWLIPDVYAEIPTIASFRDNIYPESILGTFIGKPDAIINVSEYSKAIIENTAGLFFPGLSERLHAITNGIDFDFFKPVDPSNLAKRLGLDLEEDIILLHPHRPEQGKGLAETIRVVNRLVHKHGLTRIKVLIPEWIGSMISPGDSTFYNEMMGLIQDFEIGENFIFVPWLPLDRMPELYSLGDVTLCLGNIVEAFGNVAYESLACGTPSIVSRVGVHRTLLPDEMIEKVHFGDIDEVVARILAIIDGKDWHPDQVMAALKSKVNIKDQVRSYSEIITQCEKQPLLSFEPVDSGNQTDYKLPPWVYFKDDYIYHDYQGKFENASALVELLKHSKITTKEKALLAGITLEMWGHWLEKTWLIQARRERRNDNV
ncbi:MAG: glycosyltransferase family 4 protein [Chloroflexota bacterium]|nr:glycosyltransferase family 4 protein [Chloroflexota bacterium]